jgi:hypothetical protein
VVPYWLSAIGGALLAAVLVGIATPWARQATHTSASAAIIDVIVYIGAYGSIWLVKFAYLDRMLFRPPELELPPTPPANAAEPSREWV